ncbi:hypothetical protein HMPREF0291_10809 [Corynebacterium genitalium ATCC 33030]|uniref:GH16 domain-containing protein n=2 Tax=Corynebacterium genitalium TaxID=38288 RepID=D7W9T4_9CORY|nr:hypothetical protein HMPREF0291_10809 [Corynebacterium genitalium ATCC 33030]
MKKENMKKQVVSLTVAAALVAPLAVIPAQAQADVPVHIQRTGERFSTDYDFPTFDWSGCEWAVRQTEGKLNFGGPQAADPADNRAKWVNGATPLPNGDLKIRNEGIRGGVEINAVDSTGYGTYTFEYSADFNEMDPHNVLGIFPYDMAELELNKYDEVHKNSHGSTEIDFIEISRWGVVNRPLPHGGVTYYPDTAQRPDRIKPAEFDIPAGHQTLQTIAEWEKDYLRVITKTKQGQVLSDVTSTHRVPRDTGTQQLRINLWTSGANRSEHKNAGADEIIFHDYNYSPHIGAAAQQPTDTDKGAVPPAPEADAPEVEAGTVPPAPAEDAPEVESGAVPPAPEAGAPEVEGGALPPAPEADSSEVESGAVPPAPAPEEAPSENGAPEVQPESELFDPEQQEKESKEEKAAEKSKNRSSDKSSSSSSEGALARLWRGIRGFFGF